MCECRIIPSPHIRSRSDASTKAAPDIVGATSQPFRIFSPWVFPTLCYCRLLLSCVRFSTVKFCSCRTFLLLLFDAFSLLFSRNIDFSLYFSKSAGRWADGRILKCFKFWAKGILEDEAEHGHPPTLFSLAFIILSLLLPLLPCQSKLPIPPILSLPI